MLIRCLAPATDACVRTPLPLLLCSADYIIDNAPLCNKYVRRDGTGLAGFMAGVAEGLVCAMGFKATVAAKPLDGSPRSVAFLVTLD